MSLVKCEECFKEISDEADRCPHCGVKIRKKIRWGGIAIVIVVLFVIAQCNMNTSNTSSTQKAPPDPVAEERFQKTVRFATVIKKSMRDPDSIVWESIHANDDASVICAQYRARNGFGGMSKEFFIYTKDKTSQKPDVWNKYCTKPMFDMKHVEHALK